MSCTAVIEVVDVVVDCTLVNFVLVVEVDLDVVTVEVVDPVLLPHNAETPNPDRNSPNNVLLLTRASAHATKTSALMIFTPARQFREQLLEVAKSLFVQPGISSAQTSSHEFEKPWICWNCDRLIAATWRESSVKNSRNNISWRGNILVIVWRTIILSCISFLCSLSAATPELPTFSAF